MDENFENYEIIKMTKNIDDSEIEKSKFNIQINDTININSSNCDIEVDRIVQTFIGRKIFITGGSGFVGMVLLEKLLRCFPEIGEICLLLRAKRNKTPNERLKDIFNDPFFDVLKSQKDENYIYSKIKIIAGDFMDQELGLNENDKNYLIDEISIIYHCAATVRFDEPLIKACLLNTRGTKIMIDLARECKKLECFAHVSTAYCHAHVKSVLEEKPYPTTIDPLKVIAACEKIDTIELNAISKKILKGYANTYVFTKALAEQLVSETFNELPTIILRPSIVTPVFKEPIPGWSSNFNGPVGLLIGAGKGVIRSMYCDPNKCGDMIPVDFVINGILIITWNYLNTKSNIKFNNNNNDYNKNVIIINNNNNNNSNIIDDSNSNDTNNIIINNNNNNDNINDANNDCLPRVYHLTNRNALHERWEDVITYARTAIVTRSSLGLVLWYPGGSVKKCRYHHNFCFIFYQLLPALIIDAILYCLKIPPILCKVQRRVCSGYEIFEYFTNNEWEFKNDNVYNITKLLNDKEKIEYITGDVAIDCYKYLEDCTYCSRKYLLKQKDEDIPADQKLLNVMWWVDQICKKFIIGYILYYLFNKFYMIIFGN